ncbi:MAG TPA: alpha-amlyase, partial [Marinilabiliales bacterium]|nr:alpha-amlyase [Marinilabiliales bacterium]
GNSDGDYKVKELYTALRRAELCATFFLTIPGPKMIWQFGELGYDVSIEFNGRVGEKPIKWDYYDVSGRRRIYNVYAALAKLRTGEVAFETVDYTLNVSASVKSIHLNHDDMDVVVLGNFDVVEKSINPDFQQTGTWYEFYSGESMDVTDTQAALTLAPGEYRLYTTKPFEVPVIDAVDEFFSASQPGKLIVFPNPVNSQLYFETAHDIETVSVFNLYGQQVKYETSPDAGFITVESLENGIYLMVARDKDGAISTARFIKQ